MAYTVKGRRVAFDNIAAGSATGREQTRLLVCGVPATTDWPVTDNTTVYGNFECLITSPAITSGAGSEQGREKHWRTVCGDAVTDYTTDLGH